MATAQEVAAASRRRRASALRLMATIAWIAGCAVWASGCGDTATGAAEDAGPADTAVEADSADVPALPDVGDTVAADTVDAVPDEVVAADVAAEVAADATDSDCSGGADCGAPPPCGDHVCDPETAESLLSCPIDCAMCNDHICSPGEGPKTCAIDCCGGCGDGKCVGYECGENPTSCPKDCGTPCGDGICQKGENPGNCTIDCMKQACGNHVCEPSDGGPSVCPADCGSACGNCACDKGESFDTCPNDCGFCGDGVCSVCATLGETQTGCPSDCGDFQLIGCTTAWQLFCTDLDPCTDDLCVAGEGCVHLASAGTCTDGNACTQGEHCIGGWCAGAKPIVCDDSNACTQDYCDLASGCTSIAFDGLACSDGDACTYGENCMGGLCGGGQTLPCGDGNLCTDDSCASGGCVHLANSATCSDGAACTTGDVCLAGACTNTQALDCTDANACTFDYCQEPLGVCKHVAVDGACDDGNLCTLNDACAAGVCGGAPMDCNDWDDCTLDLCDPPTGTCQHVTLTCDDGNNCTYDYCNGTGCTYQVYDGYGCDDGNACTTWDYCAGPSCTGTLVVCNDGQACTTESCDPATGCQFADVTGPCDDGNPCTGPDHCADGGCASTSLTCDDGDGCTNDICPPGVGCGHAPVDCDDRNTCTTDACAATGANSYGCTHVSLADNATCTDFDACTTGDICQTGKCIGLGALPCDDGDACTSDLCNTATGCVNTSGAAQVAYIKALNPWLKNAFGSAVAMSGDTLVVGAPGENGCGKGVTTTSGPEPGSGCDASGAAYVFVRVGSSWQQQAQLKASNAEAGDAFGTSVAVAGDTLVVGAVTEASGAKGVNGDQADNSALSAGAAYVFVRNGDAWSQQAYLKASNTDPNDKFGKSVGISGDTVVVGAIGEASTDGHINGNQSDNNGGGTGAAYVFVRQGVAWTQEAYIKPSNGWAGSFGTSTTLSSNLLAVGSPTEPRNTAGINGNPYGSGLPASGAVHTFVRTGGTWTQDAYIKAASPSQWASFGASVALQGNALIVGAPRESSSAGGINGNQNDQSLSMAGAAYLFVQTAAGWSQRAYIKSNAPQASETFGTAVAIEGSVIAIGAPGNASGVGAVYVFTLHDGWPAQRALAQALGAEIGDALGGAVAVAGTRVVSGAAGEDGGDFGVNGDATSNLWAEAGAAYTFAVQMPCDDGSACTVDSCSSGAGCSFANLADGAPCTDDDLCTVGDTCKSGVCVTAPKDCNDANACSDDACQPTGVCNHLPNAKPCDDGDICTGGDYCSWGACMHLSVQNCDDQRSCTNDFCNALAGCQHNVLSSSPETCNGLDDDCNDATDEGCDDDKDGYCDVSMLYGGTAACPNGAGDCDDASAAVHPGASETCGSGVDANCDSLAGSPNAAGCTTYYLDQDGDGYGQTGWTKCLCGAGYGATGYTTLVGGDCNEFDQTTHPGRAEWCDNIDNNCDGTTDEGCDDDDDDYCDAAMVMVAPGAICSQAGDCDDTKMAVHPNTTENCNTAYDDNCNGQLSEQYASNCTFFWYDNDGDTWPDLGQGGYCACVATGLFRTVNTTNDCNDNNTQVFPGLTGSVGCGDGIDNDCNGATDDSSGCL